MNVLSLKLVKIGSVWTHVDQRIHVPLQLLAQQITIKQNAIALQDYKETLTEDALPLTLGVNLTHSAMKERHVMKDNALTLVHILKTHVEEKLSAKR